MQSLLKLDKKFMLFLMLLPIIWDVVLRDYKNNELIQLLWIIIIYLWQLGAGKALYKKLAQEKKTEYSVFQLVFIFLLLHQVYAELTTLIDLDKYFPYSKLSFTILGMVAYGWGVYFTSSRLRELENRQNKKSDSLITFVLIFILPIGIWWMHPRVQAMIKVS